MANEIIKWPFGDASTLTLNATGAQALEIVNTLTVIDGVAVEATGNRTLNLTPDDNLEEGARVVVKTKTNGTETTIFGTNIAGTTIMGVAGKTKTVEAVYTNGAFVVIGTAGQID